MKIFSENPRGGKSPGCCVMLGFRQGFEEGTPHRESNQAFQSMIFLKIPRAEFSVLR